MNPVFLVPPSPTDAERLLAFEIANRSFFEARINARPPQYYALDGVARGIEDSIADALNDRGYQFLVKTNSGDLVGRVNLRDVRRDHFHSAVLGYRIAEAATGNGYAKEAVRKVLALAFENLTLARVEADTVVDNVASVRTLTQNGFVQFGQSKRSFQLCGVWHDRLHFERHSEDWNREQSTSSSIDVAPSFFDLQDPAPDPSTLNV